MRGDVTIADTETTLPPLAIDLFCGLGGWSDGAIAEGYQVIGFDIERHVYGDHRYPAQLVLQDVRTLHGRQFKDATLIVASPPCQAYSYRAMPRKRAKALPAPDNSLFEACKSKDGESSERVTASSGDRAQLASSGDGAQLASSGYGAKLASSGYGAQLASSGENGVICSSGWDACAKGKAGAWIALAEFGDDGKCVGFATGCAGKDFPADTWVCAKDGKLVEVGK